MSPQMRWPQLRPHQSASPLGASPARVPQPQKRLPHPWLREVSAMRAACAARCRATFSHQDSPHDSQNVKNFSRDTSPRIPMHGGPRGGVCGVSALSAPHLLTAQWRAPRCEHWSSRRARAQCIAQRTHKQAANNHQTARGLDAIRALYTDVRLCTEFCAFMLDAS